MNDQKISIAIDAMGGENAPYKILKGVDIFLSNNPNVEIVLLGNKDNIKKVIEDNKINLPKLEIINTLDNVNDDDSANTILRKKKESSIFLGLNLVKSQKAQGFVSAGNTAALMILSRLQLGMIEGVDRPAICSIIPDKNNFSIMLDLGANVFVDSRNLLQFALMGYVYHSILKPNVTPKIGIINIGTENNKGYEHLQEASDLINRSYLQNFFKGFIEPNKITSGICDILISDGYTGNIILKTAEGMSQFITNNLKNVFTKNFLNKIAYKFLSNDLKIFKDEINPDKYNGAILIGVNGVSIKSHGNASAFAFASAIEKCNNSIKYNINEKIRKEFNNL